MEAYFNFMDVFHQRTNNNQTKGIAAGTFSAHIAAELLMLCVDEKVREEILNEDIGYIRYVDDLTFFADSREALEKVQVKLQKILNQFRLRINGNKTKIYRNATNRQLTDIEEIFYRLNFLNTEKNEVICKPVQIQMLKEYIADLLERDRISQIKTVLSLLLKKIAADKIEIDEIGESLFYYLQILVFENENLVWQAYRVMDELLDELDESFLDIMLKKLAIVDEEYSDTILQIWHYFVLLKHMDTGQKRKFFREKREQLTNSLIITMFVNEGEHENSQVFRLVKDRFLEEEKGKDWKQRIMYSRWWLPLLKIKMSDSYNYEGFLQSDLFPDVLTDLILE